ncbi:hypothetical protein R3P38DRAFT_2919166 [Favolaschia claudopus]|uniref:Myb-like domain-containing protein n=1 Tax=Favolaschia claudopus TaxID=2862362 RepID=A0AAW0C0Z6_9AGAR
MQYTHISSSERRDLNLQDNPNSTPFQSHQSLGQALGPHINGSYSRPPPPDGYRISQSQSPPTLASSNHSAPALSYTPVNGQPSSSIKRKQPDNVLSGHGHVSKRRREADDPGDGYEEAGGAGAKHWTDEEKTQLFQWLMGPSHDDHWNALRATKNSCLRECAVEVFGNKKTYQALKGCYERNFNLFKQIYAFETYHAHAGTAPITSHGEADRLRDYERRLVAARRAGCDVGNITSRTIDHWHRSGWYDLFYRRWHGDPATTKPIPRGGGGTSSSNAMGGGDELDVDDDQTLDFSDSPPGASGGQLSHPPPPPPPQLHSYLAPPQHTFRESAHPPPPMPIRAPSAPSPPSPAPPAPPPSYVPPPAAPPAPSSSSSSSSDQLINIPLTQGMISAYLQFLQVQTQTGKQKLEYMRRREEREERESMQRHELERARRERDAAELEHNRAAANVKQRADKAIEVLNSELDNQVVRQLASDYLKKFFS